MLLVHDLMLLLLDDASGRQRSVSALTELLGGALLVELAAAGVIDVTDEGPRKGRLVLSPDAPPPAEPLLAEAATAVTKYAGKKPDRALRPLGKGVRERVIADLVATGILSEQQHRTLGVFRSTRNPAVSTAYEDELRARLTAVLEGAAGPDARTGPLIALLHASGELRKVVPVRDRKQARAIAKKVSEGEWAAAAVRRAVEAVQTAAILAVTTATATTGAIS